MKNEQSTFNLLFLKKSGIIWFYKDKAKYKWNLHMIFVQYILNHLHNLFHDHWKQQV